MNYYSHHIGDYARDAGYLSMVEDGCFRRLLDVYYSREQALPGDVRDCCKLARAATKVERDAVAYILREFFELREDGYHQKRCDEEIERFRAKREKARSSANARWESALPDSEGNANAMRTHSEGNATRTRPQQPITNNQPLNPQTLGSEVQDQKPLAQRAERPSDPPAGFDRFWVAYPRHAGKQAAVKAFAKLRPDEALLGVMLAALERQRQSDQWLRDGGQFVPHAATWINGRRWEDEAEPARGDDAHGTRCDEGSWLRRAV